MCLACEEQAYFFRLWCADFLARGEIPPGLTADDLQALGLPLPKPTAGGRKRKHPKRPASAANSFACDSPDE
ncbi:MAG TPA: hypothetical protein VE909_12175 [Xanthobacteraceae bacterium]|nr:hypothetical protein [Xanthobacteraceae bacterium]